MKVSFVIPLFNCLPLTQAGVASLRASLPAGLDHEIILVDNASTDGTADWLGTLPAGIRVIRNATNLGYARANNQGAAAARGELLCLLNNDLVFRRGWLEPMLRLHARLGPRAGAVGNVQRRVRDRALDHTGIYVNALGKPAHDHAWYPWPLRSRRVTAVTGACLLVARTAFLELGGFDEGFVNGGEDVDLCLRLTHLGRINAVALRSTVLHHVSASPGRKSRDEANSRRLATKWRQDLAALAWRRWCWAELARQWSGSRDPLGWAEALPLLRDALRLRRVPSPTSARGLTAMMDAEFARWTRLLGPAAAAAAEPAAHRPAAPDASG